MNKFTNNQKRALKLLELKKTPQRKNFEKENSCYIFSLRPTNEFNPEIKKSNWIIDSWLKIDTKDYEFVCEKYKLLSLRARFNMSPIYAIWLPNKLNTEGSDKIEEPEKHYDLIWKYKFKI